MTIISINPETHEALSIYKIKQKHKSHSEAIDCLLNKAEQEEKGNEPARTDEPRVDAKSQVYSG